MKRSIRLLVFATCLTGAGVYLWFATVHATAGLLIVAGGAWLAMQAVFPRDR